MSSLPKCIIKTDGINFPTIQNMYDFFSPRTKSIDIWSFGFRFGGVEIDIAESTGAKIKIFDGRPGKKEAYDIFARIMNSHETIVSDPEWAQNLTNAWILPDSTSFSPILPWTYNGTLDISGCPTQFEKIDCDRVDICKVDYDSFTTDIVYMITTKGYRPGLFFIKWDEHPDMSNITMGCAGHLQNLGYRLLYTVDNYFIYMFFDECMYEICSWSRTDCINPLFDEYRKQLLDGLHFSNTK